MRTLLAFAIVLGLLVPTAPRANHSIVPDQFATIQSAIDAGADGDTVYVREGDYPEALTLGRSFALMPLDTMLWGSSRIGVPCVQSLSWSWSDGPRAVRGFRFSDAVTIAGAGGLALDGCWFGGGLSADVLSSGHIRNCVVFGDVSAVGGSMIDIAMNTVVGGSISYNPTSASQVHDNVVVGPAAAGINAYSDAYPVRNYVRGCSVGIVSQNEGDGAANNVVEDCPVAGIRVHRNFGAYEIAGNVVRRCGRGLDLDGQGGGAPVHDNRIEDSAAEGIYARNTLVSGSLLNNTVRNSGGTAIDVGGAFHTIRGNLALVAGGAGIAATQQYEHRLVVLDNVVGHAAGAGLVLSGPMTVRGNTASMNGGAGFALTGASGDSVDHDIAFMNGGVGLAWSGAAPAMGCSDWYGNTGGATTGVAMSPTDVVLNPLFCNPAMDDVGLQAASPLAAYPGCGRIGALGVACSYAGAPAIEAMRTLALDAGPSPSAGAVRFVWAAPGGGATIEVFDVAGQRRFVHALEGERGEFSWNGGNESALRLAPGVYFARLESASGATVTRRIVLAR